MATFLEMHCTVQCIPAIVGYHGGDKKKGASWYRSSWTDSGAPARTARRGRKARGREKFRESGRNKGNLRKGASIEVTREFPRGFGKRGIDTFLQCFTYVGSVACVRQARQSKKKNCHPPVEPRAQSRMRREITK